MNNNIKYFSAAFKLMVTVLLLTVLINNAGVHNMYENVINITGKTIVVAFIFLSLQIFISTYRFQIILNAINVNLKFKSLLMINYISGFFSQALPSTVGGDAIRVYYVKRNDIRWLDSASGVFYDRYIGLLSLFFLIAGSLFFIAPIIEDLYIINSIVILAILGIASSLAIILLDKLILKLNSKKEFILKFQRVISHGKIMLTNNGILFKTTFFSLCIHLLNILTVYILSLDFNLKLTYLDFLFFMPLVFLISSIPVSLGGWGAREGAMVFFLGIMGVGNSESLVLSISYGLLFAISCLPGGLAMNFYKTERRPFQV